LTLRETKSTLGETKSTLGETKSTLGDGEKVFGVSKNMRTFAPQSFFDEFSSVSFKHSCIEINKFLEKQSL
jgi:hypothetical protein